MTARWAALTGIALALAACGGDPTSALPTTTPSRPPGMTIDCVDVPDQACTVVAAGYGTGSDQVIAITMRCTAPTCSAASGRTEIGLLFASGRRMSHGTDWVRSRRIGHHARPRLQGRRGQRQCASGWRRNAAS